MEKVIEESKQGESLVLEHKQENTKKLFIESYGCAMNFSDSEIVASILSENGFNTTQTLEEADLVLVNTCSIRDKAEQTIRKRLEKYNAVKRINPKMKVGVLGCMAERSEARKAWRSPAFFFFLWISRTRKERAFRPAPPWRVRTRDRPWCRGGPRRGRGRGRG